MGVVKVVEGLVYFAFMGGLRGERINEERFRGTC